MGWTMCLYDLNPTTIQQDNTILGQDTELLGKTRVRFPLNYGEGSATGKFDTGITLPIGMVHVQPAVNRQPGYRWGDS